MQSGAPGHRVGVFLFSEFSKKIMQDNIRGSTDKVWERITYLLSL